MRSKEARFNKDKAVLEQKLEILTMQVKESKVRYIRGLLPGGIGRRTQRS
ncbi:MAG: hypothetical protein P4M11_15545 [Candidatus Pacebacteria bacterium]|nr:hypothetical protein [Candidatus Paceibacterota bacterium]